MSEQVERSRDLERFLTFIDAVVAIAITLLVLPLVDVAGELAQGGSVTRLLRDHAPELYGFLLSFWVIARVWMAQHRVLRPVVAADPVLIRAMLAWVLMIVVLPFPTALVAEAGHQPATKVLYIGTMLLSSVLLAVMARRIDRTPAIRDSDDTADPVGSWVTAAVMAVALALSLAVPATSYWPLLLLLLSDQLVHGWHRLRGHHRPG